MLRRLLAAGIACQYTLLNAASFVMQVHTISAYLQVGSINDSSMENCGNQFESGVHVLSLKC